MDSRKIAEFSADVLDKKKAFDTVIIDIGEKSSFADYFVIASGNTDRQIGALADEVKDKLETEGVPVKSVEGKPSSGWILLDCGDVIINVLTKEMRERYNIEKVWGDCELISVGDKDAK